MRTARQIAEDLHDQLDDFNQSLELLPLMEECVRQGMIASRSNAEELTFAIKDFLSEFNTSTHRQSDEAAGCAQAGAQS